MNKLLLGAFVFAMAFSVIATPQAEAAGQASLSILYSQDQQVGATGPQATELQAFLGEQGYFNLPLGVSFGYFGGITRNALVRYQSAHGLPATGYFGIETKNFIQRDMLAHCWLGACISI